jgi:hypothetical protein
VHDEVYCTKKKGQLLRTKRWAYLEWPDGTRELYDMTADPKQFTNLAADDSHAELLAKLKSRMAKKVATIRGGK